MSIPPFASSQAPRAPFPLGAVPRAGWFCIETAFNHPSPNPAGLARGLGYEPPTGSDPAAFAEARGFGREVADARTLALLERNFNRCDAGGRGLLVTRDHASFNEAAETRATGWIKALHAEPAALWAWIEWTPWGHAMVNGGEFVHFSTEYDYGEFALAPGGAQPTRLAACTITNEPRHSGQIPCTNARRRPRKQPCPATGPHQTAKTMKTNTANNRFCRNSGSAPAPDITLPAANSDEPENALAANSAATPETDPQLPAAASDEPQNGNGAQEAPAANSEPGGSPALDLETCCQQAAELLGLADTATPEDLLAAVKGLLQSNQELNDALEEANTAANACRNSRPRFRFLTARNSSRYALQGQMPNREVSVRVGQGVRAVNVQGKSKADYCSNAVSSRERSLGRRLTPSEYSAAYKEAMRDYDAGLNR